MKDLDKDAGSRPVTHTGEVLGATYVIEINVWPDGATIENVKVVRGDDEAVGMFNGFVFVDEDAALAEAHEEAKTLAGSDAPRRDPVGVKSIWGQPVG